MLTAVEVDLRSIPSVLVVQCHVAQDSMAWLRSTGAPLFVTTNTCHLYCATASLTEFHMLGKENWHHWLHATVATQHASGVLD